jgi:muramidase (phage lysozyme)
MSDDTNTSTDAGTGAVSASSSDQGWKPSIEDSDSGREPSNPEIQDSAETSNQSPTMPPEEAPPPAPTTGSLDLHIVDLRGNAIANLDFKIMVKGETVGYGKTNAKGEIPTVENIPIGSPFEVHIRKDTGQFKLAAIGKIESEENYGRLKSPRQKFEFATYSYDGIPGTAPQHKEKTVRSHNQTPADKPVITGNPDTKPEIKQDRDENGRPKATIIDGARDWLNRNGIGTKASSGVGISDIERVKRLIEFGEKQAAWKYSSGMPTDAIIDQMIARKFKEPPAKGKVGYTNSIHACAKYVKIALWYAGYGPEKGPIGSGVVNARELGPALLAAGFTEITKDIPDGRWAAPGDVIVYRRVGDPDAAGHIDIRTYDGYLSDFLGPSLPTSVFEVAGIYRKYYDPEPEKRMRAFLKVLREWECPEEKDDNKRYFMMYQPITPDGSRRFTDMSKHPYEGQTNLKHTPAGAYQMILKTYKTMTNARFGIGPGFSPSNQDRLTVAYIEELNKKPLVLIRTGMIEEAARALVNDWSSLPGGLHQRVGRPGNPEYVFTMDDLVERYKVFLAEQEGK